jgi:diguanylate cyclase (GGDEF)-like protein
MDEDTTRRFPLSELHAGMARGWACLIMLHGPYVGRKWDLGDSPVTLGRDDQCTIVVVEDTISRMHAAIELSGGRPELVDLDSTNGTLVDNVLVQGRVSLESGAVISIGPVVFKYLAGDDIEGQYLDQVLRLAVIDSLTQIPNKHQFDTFLEREMARARRHDRQLTLLMIDIDHFKQVNDHHGHLTGDKVLREMARAIRSRMRQEDLFARYGGEEFTIVLPETGLASGRLVADAIRNLVEHLPMASVGLPSGITVSIGVAEFHKEKHARPEDLVKEVDDRLYAAKRGSRNRVSW